MSACLKDHLRTAKYCLGSKLVSLFTGHSLAYSSICHSFDEHEYISRCTAAYSTSSVHQAFWDHFCAAEAVRDLKDLIQWAQEVVALGAGEILLTSMDKDGTKSGFDLEMLNRVAEVVDVPIRLI